MARLHCSGWLACHTGKHAQQQQSSWVLKANPCMLCSALLCSQCGALQCSVVQDCSMHPGSCQDLVYSNLRVLGLTPCAMLLMFTLLALPRAVGCRHIKPASTVCMHAGCDATVHTSCLSLPFEKPPQQQVRSTTEAAAAAAAAALGAMPRSASNITSWLRTVFATASLTLQRCCRCCCCCCREVALQQFYYFMAGVLLGKLAGL